MADTTVKTGIVITGDAKGAVGALKTTAAETEKMKKRVSAMKDTVAGLPDKLGKSATSLLLFQNATSQMGGKVADAANKLSALAGLAATGGTVGIALAGLTAASIAGAAAWDAYSAEARAAENAAKSLEKIFAESDIRIKQQEDALIDLTFQLEHFGKTTREQRILVLQQDIAVTEASKASKEEEIAVMKRQSAAMIEQAKEVEALIFKMSNLSASRKLGVDDAADHAEGLRREAEHLVRSANAMGEGLKRGEQRLDLNKKTIETLEALGKKEERAVRVAKRKAQADREVADAKREAILQLREQARAERELQKILAQALKDRQSKIEEMALFRVKSIEKETAVFEANARLRDAVDQQNAAAREARAAQYESAMTSSINIVMDLEGTAADKSKALMSTLGKIAIQLAVKKIAAFAAEGGAASLTKAIEQYGVPYGLIIGGAAAAAAFAGILAWQQKLNDGGFVQPSGFVTGGVTGRDSVNASVTPGEYVASTGEVSGTMKFLNRLVGNQKARTLVGMAGMDGSTPQTSAPVSSQTVIVNQRTWVPSRTEETKMARRLSEDTSRRLKKIGAVA